MNHKRRRPKKQRAGCLFCKPHKGNGAPHKERDPASAKRRMQSEE